MLKHNCYLFFETLSTRLKLDIILLLNEGPLPVNDISNKLNEERSKVSHALKSLLIYGFVVAEKKGREHIYSLNKDTIIPLLNLVEKHVKTHCKICCKK